MASTTDYHWIITVRYGNDHFATESGVTAATSYWTRADIYAEALKAAQKRAGSSYPVHVVFFDLAPNELAGGGR